MVIRCQHKPRNFIKPADRVSFGKHTHSLGFISLAPVTFPPLSMYLRLQYLLRRRYSYRSFGVSIIQSILKSITTTWSISTYCGFWNKAKPIWIVLGLDKVLNRMSGELCGTDSDVSSVHSSTKQEGAWFIDSCHYLLVLHVFDSVVLEA